MSSVTAIDFCQKNLSLCFDVEKSSLINCKPCGSSRFRALPVVDTFLMRLHTYTP